MWGKPEENFDEKGKPMISNEKQNSLFEKIGLGPCILCKETVTQSLPTNFAEGCTGFTFERPLICDKCRKGLLKLIRPDLETKQETDYECSQELTDYLNSPREGVKEKPK
ncbi:MAG: hypothetical protein NT043_01585 [Candidatus Bathyarchaeota archaeon]|nr:hypothetical protein [Candidatus Bathyarchaeota archaeon]